MERWKAIPGHAGIYEVSDLGRVRSYQSRGRGKADLSTIPKILSQRANSNGYMRVAIAGSHVLVHRLVMVAFVGPSDMEVNHKNADRTDNRLANLEYMSTRDNRNYSYKVLGKKKQGGPRGADAGGAKLTVTDVLDMRRAYRQGVTVAEISERYNLARSSCIRAINGKTWGHIAGAVQMHNPRNSSGKNGR